MTEQETKQLAEKVKAMKPDELYALCTEVIEREEAKKNNAHIKGSLLDILNILDARLNVNIWRGEKDCIAYQRVMNILTDKNFMKAFGSYDVVGITTGINTNILIKKGE